MVLFFSARAAIEERERATRAKEERVRVELEAEMRRQGEHHKSQVRQPLT